MIKQADVKDFDKIKKMFINFANSAPVDYLHNPQYDDAHIDQILFNCSRSGVLLYAEQDGKPAGFFIAMPAGDLWLPAGSPVMREAAWWVEPAYREGTVGGKLFLQYLQVCKELKKRGFKFVGSTIVYAHMQATGMVNDHLVSCFRHAEVQQMK